MSRTIALLRGVNVSGSHKIRMEELRAMCEGMGLQEVRTYIQSGNVVFRGGKKQVGRELEEAIERTFGFRAAVVIRTAEELRTIAAQNPFPGLDPKKVVVTFLDRTPPPEAVEKVRQMAISPEEIRISGSEMYIHFPLGQGVSKLPMARIEKTLGATGTSRNWNSVMALLGMADGAS